MAMLYDGLVRSRSLKKLEITTSTLLMPGIGTDGVHTGDMPAVRNLPPGLEELILSSDSRRAIVGLAPRFLPIDSPVRSLHVPPDASLIDCIVRGLPESNLRELRFEKLPGGRQEMVRQLARGLASNRSLVLLDLKRGSISDDEAWWLASGLRSNDTLRALDLEGNMVRDRGGNRLANVVYKRALRGCPCDVDLSWNLVSDDILDLLRKGRVGGPLDVHGAASGAGVGAGSAVEDTTVDVTAPTIAGKASSGPDAGMETESPASASAGDTSGASIGDSAEHDRSSLSSLPAARVHLDMAVIQGNPATGEN